MSPPFQARGVGVVVTFDGSFISITHRGVLGRLTVGKGEKRIPVQHITAVQLKPAGAVFNGYVQFALGGGDERRSQFGRQTFDAAGDENSAVFTRDQQPAFEQLRHYVEQRISAINTPQAAPQVGGLVAELERLANLHRAGALTNEEFARAKQSLLSRMA